MHHVGQAGNTRWSQMMYCGNPDGLIARLV